MMSGLDRCIASIIAETGTTLDKESVGEVLEEMVRRADHPRARQRVTMTPEMERIRVELEAPQSQALQQARDMMLNRSRRIHAQQRLNVIMNAEKTARRRQIYDAAPSPELGIQSQLIGTNAPFRGSRDSAEAAINGNRAALLGAFQRDLEASNTEDVFRDNHLEREWAQELFQLNSRDMAGQPNGRPGITNNAQALAIARAIERLQTRALDLLNSEGAYVGRYNGYIARTSHTPELIARMGEAGFKALARRTWDFNVMYPNRDPRFIEASLTAHWQQLSSGVYGEFADGVEAFVPRGANVARKVSESRAIHFKDADAWLEYTRQASEQRPAQIIIGSAMKAARDAGLMRIWGTNPKLALENDMNHFRTRARALGGEEAQAMLGHVNAISQNAPLWMSILTGEANRITNRARAAVFQNIMAVQRLAKLGMLPFAQFSDLANIASEARYQGVHPLRAYWSAFGSYFNHGLNSEKRQVARLVGAGLDSWLQDIHLQMESIDPQVSGGAFTGMLARTQNFFFRYSGATALTNRARAGAVRIMAEHFGQFRDTPFAGLDRAEARILRAFNVTEAEWEALRSADWLTGSEGHRLLTPDAAERIPDAAINAYIATLPTQISAAEARQQIGQRLYSYFADRMDYGVLNLGVGERAIMSLGFAADHPAGIALRLLWQFKSFMAAQIRRTWGREIYGRPGETLGKIGGLIEFATFSTIMGLTANALTQVAKGQDPFSQYENDPGAAVASGLTRGGAGSIIGDFLFSEFNRFGQGPAEYEVGPSFGTFNDLLMMAQQLKRGENPAGDFLRFAKSNTPFMNLFWSKWATDYLLWNGLTEAAKPGYLQRAERNLKKNQGLEYLKRPIDFAPNNWRAF